MSRNNIVAIVVISIHLCSGCEANASKERDVAAIIEALDSLARFSRQNSHLQTTDPQFRGKVHNGVCNTIAALSPSQLARFAIICNTIYYPGDAADVGYDETYYAGFWCAIEHLCEKPSAENYRLLQFVRRRIPLDGSEKLRFEEMLAKVRSTGNSP